MISTETMVPSNKLKIKFGGCKRIEADPGKKMEQPDPQSSSRDFGHQVSLREVSSVAESSSLGSKKRGPSENLEAPKEKKLKMDRSVKVQCSMILRTLMNHKDGWAFRDPVDPEKLKIPDYFTIISHPMDLGTIKSKLEKNRYHDTEEVAADVRLTFSNAMLYNPPGNAFHQMAKNLNKIFEMRWRLLDGKLNHGSSKVETGKSLSGQIDKVTCPRQNPCRTPPLHSMPVTKRSISSEEKTRVPLGASDREAEHSRMAQNCTPKLKSKNFNGGIDSTSRQASGTMNAKQPSTLVGRKCSSCSNIACRCRLPSDLTHLSSSDLSSESSVGRYHPLSNDHASRLDCQVKSLSTSHVTKSDLESDGAVSALDDESICASSQHSTPVADACGEEWRTSLDVQLSPERALRAARLKSRFADTIWKAEQKKLLDNGDRSDPLKMQQEKARLERRQREEKARIEAEIKAAEAATQMKAKLEWKLQCERKREEARIEVEKVQRTVEIEPNLKIQEELDRLTGFSPSTPLLNRNGGFGVFSGAHLRSPLEQLGLFIKAEYSGDEDDESILYEEGEEGEIF